MDPVVLALTHIQDILTGDAKEGEMNNGMLYKRQTTEPIINFVAVNYLDTIRAKVDKLGGRIIRAKEEIKSVGHVAIIQDSEGNVFGIWKPE